MSQIVGAGRKAAGHLAQMTMQRWGLGVGALVLAVSGIFGGLNETPDPPKPVNTEIDTGPFKVTVTRAYVTDQVSISVAKDKRWLVVEAKVEVTADETWRLFSDIIWLAQTPGVKARAEKVPLTEPELMVQKTYSMVLTRDKSAIEMLHPDMPEQIQLIWDLEAGGPIPTKVSLYAPARVWRADSLTDMYFWMPAPENNVELTVDVADRRGTATQ